MSQYSEKKIESVFIGPEEVKGFEVLELKTPLDGKPILKVSYLSGREEMMTQKIFDLVSSKEPISLTDLRENKITPLAREILGLYAEYGIKVSEIDFLNRLLDESLQERIEESNEYLYGNPSESRNVLDYHKILIQKANEQPKQQSEEDGDGGDNPDTQGE